MSTEFPQYPELPAVAQAEAGALLQKFTADMLSAAKAALSDLYVDYLPHIESDTWSNFRNSIIAGLTDYRYPDRMGQHDWRAIRAAILAEHREAIIADLNQDHLKKIAELEATIKQLNEFRSY